MAKFVETSEFNRLLCIQIVVYFVACNNSIAILTFNPRQKHDLWRFFTYYTVHYNLIHLVVNVILQVKHLISNERFQNPFFNVEPSPLPSEKLFEMFA